MEGGRYEALMIPAKTKGEALKLSLSGKSSAFFILWSDNGVPHIIPSLSIVNAALFRKAFVRSSIHPSIRTPLLNCLRDMFSCDLSLPSISAMVRATLRILL